MAVKILIKRKVSESIAKDLMPLFARLRNLATAQPGYISGETLKSTDRLDVFLVISTWASSSDWENWLKNKDRQKIQGKIDALLGGNTSYEIFQYGLRD